MVHQGRGPGGRTARRRVAVHNGTSVSFDHAAPFFSSTTRTFREGVLKEWQQRGIAETWNGNFASFDASGGFTPASDLDSGARWLGVPTMHTICRSLSDDVSAGGGEMFFGRHVLSTEFSSTTSKWRIAAHNRFADEGMQREEHDFDALVLSDKLLVLPNQYAVLSEQDIGLLSMPAISSEACVVLLVALDRSKIPGLGDKCLNTWDVLEAEDSSDTAASQLAVRLIVHESTKPQRDRDVSSADLDLWVVHSGSGFAAQHLREEVEGEAPALEDEEAVKAQMLAEFLRILSQHGGGEEADVKGVAGNGREVASSITNADLARGVVWSSIMVGQGKGGRGKSKGGMGE